MSVLTLAGKPINWAKPPKATTRVMWSQRTTGGKTITGSLRTIAHLDRLNYLAKKKFGVGIIVYQGPYNTTVPASAGTHDFDACLDVWIPGVDGLTQQAFLRANGAGDYYRKPPLFTPHQHYFTLPERVGTDVSDDYKSAGFKVGYLVDGGWSQYGKVVGSSQIADYYAHRNALASHAPDPTWFPPDIGKTIFDLNKYIARQVALIKPKSGTLLLMTANIASKREVPELLPVLAKRQPHVVGITEAYFARAFLKAIPGYRLYQYNVKGNGAEGPDVAVLVRRGVKVSRRRALAMTKTWTSPKGKQREPRVYPSMNVNVGGFWWRVLIPHFPTVGNNEAQGESERAVNKWFSQGDRPSTAAGDFNQKYDDIVEWIRQATVARGTKVDHVAFARCFHQTTERLSQPEGMHGWIIYTFTTETKG